MVPIFESGTYLDAREIKNELDLFQTIIKDTINFIKKYKYEIKTTEDLRIFNDSFVLLIDSLYSTMRRNTAICIINSFFKQELTEDIETFYHNLQSITDDFLAIPADTRPLANAASLWIHMKTTSALAVTDYVSTLKERRTDENRELLRFACLFHDIGKPFNRKSHVSEALKVLDEFFKGYMKPEYLKKVGEWISKHHDKNAEAFAKRIQEADWVSSGIERQSDYIKQKLISLDPVKFKWVKDQVEFNKWENWEKLDEELEYLTKRLISDFRKDRQSFSGVIDNSNTPTLALVMCDARGIKEFVDNSLKLREIKGGAILIDEALTVQIDRNFNIKGILTALLDFSIPPECIIFYGGGNILFFADTPRIEELKRSVTNAFLDVVKHGIGLSVTHIEFGLQKDLFFGALYKNLLKKMSKYKNELKNFPAKPIEFGFKRLCSSCNRAIAEYEDLEKRWICSSCYNKRQIGTSEANIRAFKTTWQRKYKENLLAGWEEIREKIPEFIAGMTLDDIINNKESRRPSIGVIKADGNNMGKFFGSSVTITELIEKSIKTDIAMDACITELKEIIKQVIHTGPNSKHQEEMLARIDLGIIYAGGDDFLMFAPSWLSIPIALILMERFVQVMGNLVKLSVGIVAGDPKQPQNYLIKAAELMLENGKRLSRNDKKTSEVMGYLDYENIEGGTYTTDIIKYHRKMLSGEKYVSRPFRVPFWQNKNHYPINQIIDEIVNKQINNPAELIGLIHDNLRELREKSKKTPRFRELRNRLLDILNRFEYSDLSRDINLGTLYAIYQYSRSTFKTKKEIKEMYNKIGVSLAESILQNQAILLLDEYIILKLIGGGFL